MTRASSDEEQPARPRHARGGIELAAVTTAVRPPPPGVHAVELGRDRGGHVYVPRAGALSARLAVLLHGAGGHSEPTLGLLRDFADDNHLLLVAPQSRGRSWDVIVGGLGPDVATVEGMLAWAKARFAIDTRRTAIGGFSDGASYALTLGLANGDVFPVILAFSPGFASPPRRQGRPRVFVSHGRRDAVLPIDHCSRALVPRLRGLGYHVVYDEFDGPHTVPPETVARAVRWWLE